MFTIYRLEREHKTRKIGLGAYRFKSNFRIRLSSAHNNPDTHPNLHGDFDSQLISTDMHFACQNTLRFHIWFGNELLEEAYMNGLTIAKYEVHNMLVSNSKRQCVFYKKDIINKEYLSLEEFNKS
tara:strand:+ start:28332 stop:28706 length:375 start_codon:yes stop_codon:yes gene_type:complete